jgi:hypothetical protein
MSLEYVHAVGSKLALLCFFFYGAVLRLISCQSRTRAAAHTLWHTPHAATACQTARTSCSMPTHPSSCIWPLRPIAILVAAALLHAHLTATSTQPTTSSVSPACKEVLVVYVLRDTSGLELDNFLFFLREVPKRSLAAVSPPSRPGTKPCKRVKTCVVHGPALVCRRWRPPAVTLACGSTCSLLERHTRWARACCVGLPAASPASTAIFKVPFVPSAGRRAPQLAQQRPLCASHAAVCHGSGAGALAPDLHAAQPRLHCADQQRRAWALPAANRQGPYPVAPGAAQASGRTHGPGFAARELRAALERSLLSQPRWGGPGCTTPRAHGPRGDPGDAVPCLSTRLLIPGRCAWQRGMALRRTRPHVRTAHCAGGCGGAAGAARRPAGQLHASRLPRRDRRPGRSSDTCCRADGAGCRGPVARRGGRHAGPASLVVRAAADRLEPGFAVAAAAGRGLARPAHVGMQRGVRFAARVTAGAQPACAAVLWPSQQVATRMALASSIAPSLHARPRYLAHAVWRTSPGPVSPFCPQRVAAPPGGAGRAQRVTL